MVGCYGMRWDLVGRSGIWWDLVGSGGIWWDLVGAAPNTAVRGLNQMRKPATRRDRPPNCPQHQLECVHVAMQHGIVKRVPPRDVALQQARSTYLPHLEGAGVGLWLEGAQEPRGT